jgi:hypothetical protein
MRSPLHNSLFVVFFLLSFFAAAQCPVGMDAIRVEVNTDWYYYETSWTLTNLDGSAVYGNGTVPDSATHSYIYCVPEGQCVKFTIYDDAFDGLFPDGWYRLYVNDEVVYERLNGSFFGGQESVNINCPPGTSCIDPLTLQVGSGFTPNGNEVWYSFVPQDTGSYVIATCDAACSTKIWVYDHCDDIFISENQLGAIFYSETGCPDGAAAVQMSLAGGKEYFIRIRYSNIGCSANPIPYTVAYLGPISGCLDPTACNYDPLATIQGDTCIYPGDPACPNAPDLWVNEALLNSSVQFSTLNNPDPCAVEEGCLRGLGARHIIGFSTHIKNIGDEDYYIGPPPANINEPSTQFVYDPCHQHWHYLGYADYLLFNSEGLRIPIGSKTGFCVLDLECSDGGDGKYDCINMGISAQCGDVYDIGLPCQWIDITGIPADNYTMVVRVNWDKSPDKLGRVEKTYDNNWGQVCFSLTYSGNTPDVEFVEDSCQLFTDCTGVVFGDAQPDCNGVCNGPSLHGDINQDTLRNEVDVQTYLSAALANNGDASTCNDLYDDGLLNVYDAALLQECNIHADNQQHWIQRFPCQFPTGFANAQDPVTLRLGMLDTLAKTLDIQIVNPFNKIMGYEFTVSGLNIASVENLANEHNATPQFNAASGKLIALSADESVINKHATPMEFVRIHYNTITASKICIESIQAVVNEKYQLSNAMIGQPDCIPTNVVAVSEPGKQAFAVYVQPNPMRESTTVFFENKQAEPVQFTLSDLTGRTLRSFNDLRGESVTIERNGLPEGTYYFTLRDSRGMVSGKIVMQ